MVLDLQTMNIKDLAPVILSCKGRDVGFFHFSHQWLRGYLVMSVDFPTQIDSPANLTTSKAPPPPKNLIDPGIGIGEQSFITGFIFQP